MIKLSNKLFHQGVHWPPVKTSLITDNSITLYEPVYKITVINQSANNNDKYK